MWAAILLPLLIVFLLQIVTSTRHIGTANPNYSTPIFQNRTADVSEKVIPQQSGVTATLDDDARNAIATERLARQYQEGQGVPKDCVKAFDLYQKAANSGNLFAINDVGVCYERGIGVQKEYVQAVKWYQKAADAGNSYGMMNLGSMYRDGLGVTNDDAEAVKWFRRAVDAGNVTAMTNLGNMYMNGRGTIKDETEAYKLVRNAANAGDAEGMGYLGWMYGEGHGVPNDDTEAVKWYQRAADAGSVIAMANLGNMYKNARGVLNDDAKAVAWFRKAADRGNPAGMTKLGFMYAAGRGVSKDDDEAAKWFRKAAELGDDVAKKWLQEHRTPSAPEIIPSTNNNHSNNADANQDAERIAREQNDEKLRQQQTRNHREIDALKLQQSQSRDDLRKSQQQRQADIVNRHSKDTTALANAQSQEQNALNSKPASSPKVRFDHDKVVVVDPATEKKNRMDQLLQRQAQDRQALANRQTQEDQLLALTFQNETNALSDNQTRAMKSLVDRQNGIVTPAGAGEQNDPIQILKGLLARQPGATDQPDLNYADETNDISFSYPANFKRSIPQLTAGQGFRFSGPPVDGLYDEILVSWLQSRGPNNSPADIYARIVVNAHKDNPTEKYSDPVKTTLAGAEAIAFTIERAPKGIKMHTIEVLAVSNGKIVMISLTTTAGTFDRHWDDFKRLWDSMKVK